LAALGRRSHDLAVAVDGTGDGSRPPSADRADFTRPDPRSARSFDRARLGELVQNAVDAAEIRGAIARFGAGTLAFDRGLGCASLRVAIGCSANGTGVDGEQQEAQG